MSIGAVGQGAGSFNLQAFLKNAAAPASDQPTVAETDWSETASSDAGADDVWLVSAIPTKATDVGRFQVSISMDEFNFDPNSQPSKYALAHQKSQAALKDADNSLLDTMIQNLAPDEEEEESKTTLEELRNNLERKAGEAAPSAGVEETAGTAATPPGLQAAGAGESGSPAGTASAPKAQPRVNVVV